jgi:MFS family permease
MYLPVPIFGYLVDRYSPRPVSLFAALVFALGYFLAAFTYKSGPSTQGGWPFGVMILAFVGIGVGTSSMYLAAVTACVKNFGHSKYKGVALAMPIASFGLSGMWQSQIGSKVLYETQSESEKRRVDVFRYFIFLGVTLLVVGLIGAVAQVVVDQDELIDEAVEDLERSGMLEESPFFRRNVLYEAGNRGYGTLSTSHSETGVTDREPEDLSASMLKVREEDEAKKKWLLNGETRRFLSDHTMWFLALGFFLVTGPVETFINNVGTMVTTLYPPPEMIPDSNDPALHVAILGITSTIARLAAGILSDVISPSPSPPHQYRALTPSASQTLSNPFDSRARGWRQCTVSRLTLLVSTAGLFLVALIYMLAVVPASPQSFPFVTALIGLVNGACFALVPLLISSVWGVENFGTNWGIVATMPALGATVWSALYSVGYDRATSDGLDMCYGTNCWTGVVGGMVGASVIAGMSWILVGWGKDGWWKRGVVV